MTDEQDFIESALTYQALMENRVKEPNATDPNYSTLNRAHDAFLSEWNRARRDMAEKLKRLADSRKGTDT